MDSFPGFGVNQPRFGAERMGSPTESYARLGKNPTLIRTNTQVYAPNYVGVLDDTLLDDIDVTEGITPGGWLIVNTTMSFDEIREKIHRDDINFAKLDATNLALEVLGRNITNTVILGALVKVSDIFTLEQLKDAIFKTFKASIAEKNAKVVEMAYERTEMLDLGFKMNYEADTKEPWSQIDLGKPGYKERDLAGVWYTLGGSEKVKTGSWGVSVAQWNKDLCINCHRCFLVCPDLAILRELGEDGDYHVAGVDEYHCKGCMNCVLICPKNALTEKMKKEPVGGKK
ncbi:MAG: 2-oxoacid:acceptor oxidoreductase family protein [Candidatus Lokiarchaeota archaeon]|nr:2-oxoacid:acceptor oxidoreductase family protein [Candidatus Lokiarchaeota archaeon]